MGAKKLKSSPRKLQSAIAKLTGNLDDGRKPSSMVARLARHLLNSNRHLKQFEVELCDESMCRSIERELAASGCRVLQIPFKWRLVITLPDETPGELAA